MHACGRGVIHAERNTRQQQFCEYGFASHCGSAEKLSCRDTLTPCFEQTSFVEQNECFVQINQRWPNMIPVADKQFPGSRKELDPFKRLSPPAGCDGGENQCLGSFVSKT